MCLGLCVFVTVSSSLIALLYTSSYGIKPIAGPRFEIGKSKFRIRCTTYWGFWLFVFSVDTFALQTLQSVNRHGGELLTGKFLLYRFFFLSSHIIVVCISFHSYFLRYRSSFSDSPKHILFRGARWRSQLSHCARSRKVASSIPDCVITIFHLHNPSGLNMALGLNQPLT